MSYETKMSLFFAVCAVTVAFFFVYFTMGPDNRYCLDTSDGRQICVEDK